MARTTPAQKPRGWARMTRIKLLRAAAAPLAGGQQELGALATQQMQFPASGYPIQPLRWKGQTARKSSPVAYLPKWPQERAIRSRKAVALRARAAQMAG